MFGVLLIITTVVSIISKVKISQNLRKLLRYEKIGGVVKKVVRYGMRGNHWNEG